MMLACNKLMLACNNIIADLQHKLAILAPDIPEKNTPTKASKMRIVANSQHFADAVDTNSRDILIDNNRRHITLKKSDGEACHTAWLVCRRGARCELIK